MASGGYLVRLRRVTFWLFVAVYIGAVPFLILYALGKTPQDLTSAAPVPSGVIHVVTHPADSSVSVDGKRISGKTPVTLERIPAGVHTLDITHDGYRPWTGTVRITAGHVAPQAAIQLFPGQIPVHTVMDTRVDRIIPLPSAGYIIVVPSSGADLFLYGLIDHSVISLKRRLGLSSAGGTIVSLRAIRPIPAVIVGTKAGDRAHFFVINFHGAGYSVETLPVSLVQAAQKESGKNGRIVWVSAQQRSAYVFQASTLKRLTLAGTEIRKEVISDQVSASGLVRGGFAFVAGDSINQIEESGTIEKLGTISARLMAGGRNESRSAQILEAGRIHFVALSPDGNLILANLLLGSVQKPGKVDSAWLDSGSGRLIVLRDHNVGFLTLPQLGTENGNTKIDWISELEGNPNGFFQLTKTAQILVLDNHTITAIVMSPFLSGDSRVIAKVASQTEAYLDPTWGYLYYVNADNGLFEAAEIGPSQLKLHIGG